MLHSSERLKDFREHETSDWMREDEFTLINEKFYAIADLAKDGFIHADGSLKFEFAIKRHNF